MIVREMFVEFVFPAIAERGHDWMAYLDGNQEDGPFGCGETKQAAIDDLAEQLDENGEWV